MIIVYNYKDKKPFTIIGKKKSGGGGGDVEPKPLLKSKIYIGTDGSSHDDIEITIPKEVGSFYGSVGNDYENSTFYPNEEGTVLTTNSSAGYSLFNMSKTDTSSKSISFNRKVQVEIDLFEDIDDYAFNRLFYQSDNVSKVVITSYNVKIGKSAFENTFSSNIYLTEVILDLKNSELSEGTFIGTFKSCYNLNKLNIGLVQINENCKNTFKETFQDAGNEGYIEGRFDLPEDRGRIFVPESCFEYCFASSNLNGGFNLYFDIFRFHPNVIKKRGMYGMFYNNKNIKATPFIEMLYRVEEQGMGYCFSNTSALDRIQIDFRFLEYVGSEGFIYMFSNNNNSNLHFEVYDGDISNILMNIGNTNTVFSEFSCYYMFERTYINSPNLLYVDYNNPIPEGCFAEMFSSSEKLQTMGIGNMTFNYRVRHPFQNTFKFSQRLNKIYSKLTDYSSITISNWLQYINTRGAIQVTEDANLVNYDWWLPLNWIIVDENGNAIIDLPEVGSDEDILYIQNVDEYGGEITLTETNDMLYYSIDGYNWETYIDDTPIYVGNNDLVFFKYNTFDVTIQPYMYNIPFRYHVGGELKGIGQGGMYANMFNGQTNLIDASKLKLNGADSSSSSLDCHQMFYDCTNLLRGAEIMIEYINYGSFVDIFYGCSSLESLKIHCTDVQTNILYSSSSSGTLYCPLNCNISLPSGWIRVNIE